MSDRLKQIWGGFASETTRRLTSRDINDLVAPPREDWKANDAAFLPEGYNAPAQAAFDALKTQLASKAHKAEKRRRKKGKTVFHNEAPPPPLSGDASFSDAPREAKEMIRGLKATEDRIIRSSQSYAAWIESDEGRAYAPPKKRKKFFGIF